MELFNGNFGSMGAGFCQAAVQSWSILNRHGGSLYIGINTVT